MELDNLNKEELLKIIKRQEQEISYINSILRLKEELLVEIKKDEDLTDWASK